MIRLLLLPAAVAALLAQCHAPASPPAPLGFAAIAQPGAVVVSTLPALPDPAAPEPPPTAPSPPPAVPGPLPLLGLGAALVWARRLRRRIKAAQSTTTPPR